MTVVAVSKGVVAPNKLSSSVLKACGLALLATTIGLSSNNLYAANAQTMQHDHSGHEQAKVRIHANKKQLEQQTLELAATMGELRRANKGVKVTNAVFEQQLEELVDERQVSQYALLQLDANAALRTILPEAKRSGMPAHIEAKLAQRAEVAGELEIVYEDFADHSQSRQRHFLNTDNGRVEMHVLENAQKLQSGMQVKAKGWMFNAENKKQNDLVVEQGDENLVILAAGSEISPASTSSYQIPTKTTGEQKVLVLMLNFQDNQVEPWTAQEVEQMVFGTVSDYFRETSNGQTWLAGDAQGYLTLPIDTTCVTTDIELAAREVATNNGVDLSQYPRLVFLMPKSQQCENLRGTATLGLGVNADNPSRAWIFGELNLMTIGHEFGHNLGLRHAKFLGCPTERIDSQCISLEYGDNLDIMGKSEGHFNAFNKEKLGWIKAEKGEVVTAENDGSYLLEPYEMVQNGTAKSLKVHRGTDSATGIPLYYYLEYRQPVGFDGFLSGKDVTQGVIVHLNRHEDNLGSSLLLDMTPGSSIYDLDDAALLPGKSFHDAEAGVTITTEWADSAGVSVNISYSAQQSCVAAQPIIALVSNNSVWAEPGETVSYSATLTNNDSAECASNDYIVSAQVPQDWNGTQKALSLAPGESATVSVSVTSSTTATDGFYDVTIKGVNNSDNGYQASTTASYVVEAPVAACVSANPQWTLLNNSSSEVAAGTSVTYSGTLTNMDNDSCAASTFDINASLPAGWSATNPSVNLLPGQSQTMSVNVTSAAEASAGVYDFSLLASNRDNGGYQSADSATYQVAAPVASCQITAPNLSVVNAVGAEVEAGTVQYYNVEITNQNQDCADATYNLSIATPSGWSASNNKVTLADGATTTVSVNVMSSTSASAGSYDLTLTAQDAGNVAYSSTSTLVYRVIEQQNTAPVANSDSVTLASKTAVYIDVLDNDEDIDGDTLIVISATQGAKGSVQVLSDGRIKYTPAKNFKDSDSFSYTISDGQLQSTATVNVTLAGDAGNGGGGSKGKGKN